MRDAGYCAAWPVAARSKANMIEMSLAAVLAAPPDTDGRFGVVSRLLPPSARLTGLARQLWDVRADLGAAATAHRVEVLSDPGITVSLQYRAPLILTLAGRTQRLTSHVTGVHDVPLTIGADGPAGNVAVKLTPEGAARLFGGRVAELARRQIDLRDVISPVAIDRVQGQLAEATDSAARMAIVERFLLDHMTDDRGGDRLACDAAARIVGAGGAVRIGELAADYGLGERQFERRFRQLLGLSPKAYARIGRLQVALKARMVGADWARAAYEAGFCDQAHLIRDFRGLTGRTPSGFFRQAARTFGDLNRRLGRAGAYNTFFV